MNALKKKGEKMYFSSKNLNKWNKLSPLIKDEPYPSAFKAKAERKLLDSIP